MLLSLLLLALAALPEVRAAPAGRLTHGGLALLHDLEDDVYELDAQLGRSSNVHNGARRELERGSDTLFKAAGPCKKKWILSKCKDEEDLQNFHTALASATPEDLKYREDRVFARTQNTVHMQMVAYHDRPNAAEALHEAP